MYSGWILTNNSGVIFGAHQRINRYARTNLNLLNPKTTIPSVHQIQYFEGNNGPDGVKRKSPGRDDPMHYFDPEQHHHDNSEILSEIKYHSQALTRCLAAKDMVEAAFNAAWISHTIVDGLTPAHHFPYVQTLEKLTGRPNNTRNSFMEKNVIKGKSPVDTLSRNWQYWGAKGLFTNHFMYEFGASSAIIMGRLSTTIPDQADMDLIDKLGVVGFFEQMAANVNSLGIYEKFVKHGWTPKLGSITRRQLAPIIIKSVTLVWWYCEKQASIEKSKASV
jgi:hypothetical protein